MSAAPLILAAWHEASDEMKRDRLKEHILYAAKHDMLDLVDDFLRSIPERAWYRGW